MLRLDRALAQLLDFVDKRIGLQNTLIVLSADHGGADVPAQLNEFGIAADYVAPDEWDKRSRNANLKKRFGVGEELI
jgi:arylsulfatase A-like enzyme